MASDLSLMFAPVPRLQPRCRRVAVMFADLDHFTQLCSEAPPRKVYRLVQDFQGVVTRSVSRCKGTVNAFAGDGALATFHDLTGRAGCATRALRCAWNVLEGIQDLNLGYHAAGAPSVSVSIGLQYGQTLFGETAVPRRFGSTIIGDAVNVASRLEQRARALSARIVVGDELVQRARQESGADVSELTPLAYVGHLSLDGRTGKVGTWIFHASTTPGAAGCRTSD
jgi:adenylate cyclase